MSPHTAWLILQGIETLPLRMERHMANTEQVVRSWPSTLRRPRGPPAARIAPQPRAGGPLLAGARRGAVFSFDIKGTRAQGKAFIEA
jgi:O-acetylhomoserine (thiol)-lyase